MEENVDRRHALKRLAKMGLVTAAVAAWPLSRLLARLDESQADSITPPAVTTGPVYVASGGEPAARVRAMFRAMGGVERFVRPGSRVVVKPNIGFARTPDVGATTHPDIVEEIVRLCRAAGARSVKVFENPCDNYVYTFQKSGIAEAVARAGGEIFPATVGSMFRKVLVPRGKTLRTVNFVSEVLQADCLINVPTAKVHSSASLTLGLKNMMGLIQDRGLWHLKGLDGCIADLATQVRPHLVMIDATRILKTHGPQGPGELETPQILIASQDIVAVDAWAASLFGKKGRDLGYLRLAHEHGLGEIDEARMKVVRL